MSNPSNFQRDLALIETIIRERDEARDWVRKLQKETQTLTCVFCGEEYPPGSPTHGSQVLVDHIRTCTKHPMRQLEEQRTKIRSALAALVGVGGNDRDELIGMKAVVNAMGQPGQDMAAINMAIDTLIETIPPTSTPAVSS